MRSMESAVTALGMVAATVTVLLGVAAVEGAAVDNRLGEDPLTVVPGVGRYMYHEERRSWSEAHQVCSGHIKGHLAVVDSEEEAQVLVDLMRSGYSQNTVHIGFHDQFEEGSYVTVRGQSLAKLGYHNWVSGQPSGSASKNCGALYSAGNASDTGLTDIDCSTLQPFICELPLWDDYELLPGYGYYKLHNAYRLWSEALETCRSEGGYLLVLNSAAERDALYDKYASQTIYYYIWYGGHHKFTNEDFITIFDEPLADTGYSTWYPGFPGGYTNIIRPYMMLHFHLGDTNNDLLLESATAQYPFICKHDLHDL